VSKLKTSRFTIKNTKISRLWKGKEPELKDDGREDPER